MSSTNSFPLNTAVDIESFLDTAGNNVFTPFVVVARQNGIPAKSLQTDADISFPYGTHLILGRKIESTSKYSITICNL